MIGGVILICVSVYFLYDIFINGRFKFDSANIAVLMGSILGIYVGLKLIKHI